jgi:hypothetical protein
MSMSTLLTLLTLLQACRAPCSCLPVHRELPAHVGLAGMMQNLFILSSSGEVLIEKQWR